MFPLPYVFAARVFIHTSSVSFKFLFGDQRQAYDRLRRADFHKDLLPFIEAPQCVHAHTHIHTHTCTPPRGDLVGTSWWWADRSATRPAWVIISWSGDCSQWALLLGGHSPSVLVCRLFSTPLTPTLPSPHTPAMIGFLHRWTPRMFFSASVESQRTTAWSQWQLTSQTNEIALVALSVLYLKSSVRWRDPALWGCVAIK